MRLRNAIEQYAFAARFHNQEDRFIKYMSDMLDQATKQLQKSADMDAQVTSELMTIASNLHQSNQATQQLRNLRGQFSQPNIHISVDESFVRRMVSQSVAQPQDVNECILGTRILGTAFMNGSVSASLLPMQNGIGIQLDLSACLTSQSRGYNRGVVINSTSSSPVLASKQVYLSEHGISSPATTVSTQLNSTIHSIEHRSRLVRRIAQRKAAEQKPQADSIAEGRMQSRVCTEFTQQVDQQVAQANHD